jgi:hypothetical protein
VTLALAVFSSLGIGATPSGELGRKKSSEIDAIRRSTGQSIATCFQHGLDVRGLRKEIERLHAVDNVA